MNQGSDIFPIALELLEMLHREGIVALNEDALKLCDAFVRFFRIRCAFCPAFFQLVAEAIEMLFPFLPQHPHPAIGVRPCCGVGFFDGHRQSCRVACFGKELLARRI